jgi:hypothetical protein
LVFGARHNGSMMSGPSPKIFSLRNESLKKTNEP